MKLFHHSTPQHEPTTLTPDAFYEEIGRDWQERARRLQTRRWEAIRQHPIETKDRI